MKRTRLILCLALALPLPALSSDPAACAAFANAVDAGLKDVALAKTLSRTSPNPAVTASTAQEAERAMQIVDQNLRMMTQSGCAPYPRPVDPSGYNTDAMWCAYEILQQRPATSLCDKSTWTLKGQIETWHTFGGKPGNKD